MRKDFKLSDVPKRNMYQVPENYFERLPTRIMARTAAAEAPQPAWQQSLWRPLRLALAPLVLLLVFAGVYYFNISRSPEPATTDFAALAEAEIVDYLTSNDAQLETADFADLTSLSGQELTADFLNVSQRAAEEELEYHPIEDENF
ncbi:hypothetical protein I2I11_05015 [Pontibacter sp. 172403-2]|nr:hypothetical protein [Pontibacter sp. 172403-2]